MLDLCYYLREYHLSNTAMLVYGLLDGLSKASAKRGKPYTYISRRSIGERIGKSERTAQRAVKELERANLVMVKRQGRNLNDHIFVFSPKTTQEEKAATVENANHSVYVSGQNTSKMSCPINTEKVIKNHTDKSIYPANDKKDVPTAQNKGYTTPKGKPTNKQRRRTIEEKQEAKKRYKDFLMQKFHIEEDKYNLFSGYDEYTAVMKIIELISNTMASKGKIMVNGSLMMPIQWWYVVKEISVHGILSLIYKLEKTNGIKNYRAYVLASIYNKALEETLQKPWYVNAAY